MNYHHQERLARAAKKDIKLLSFGDEEEAEEEGPGAMVGKKRGGLKSSHEVLADPALANEVIAIVFVCL